ncbi:MAG: VWA domain-containing protein [Methanosarcinaceae archaeon]|nr:VWA domain-containing protein [Methanosarcinaceae archaeon]
MLSLGNPQLLWLMVPVVITGLYLIMKGAKTGLVESRIIVAALLVIALASPYNLVIRTNMDETPDIVVISDETSSMALFKEGVASRLYEALTAKTPTTLVKVSGDKTSLGDAIVQYSSGDNQIVIVTDGNNNYGKNLEDSLKFAKDSGTTVYAVQPEIKTNDMSIEITGDKTVVVGNENLFEIIVSQAGDTTVSYRIEVYADDKLLRSGTFSQSTREKTIQVKHFFEALGAHTLSATLTPLDEDKDPINNVFYKSVYVVPKPKILLIADETTSPLAQIIYNLYDVSSTDRLSDINDKKVVVLDNKRVNSLSQKDVSTLKKYVTDGHGLVVVGGELAYDYGDYLNSSFEELLPVMSKPTEWRGGRNVVLVLDVSGSTLYASHIKKNETWVPVENNILDIIKANAINILTDEDLKDADVAVIAFGTDAVKVSDDFEYVGISSNVERIELKIRELTPGEKGLTSLNEGILLAKEMISNLEGEKNIIIISDGEIAESYDSSLEILNQLNNDVKIYFIHTTLNPPYFNQSLAKKLMIEVGGTYMNVINDERANLVFEEIENPPDYEAVLLYAFPLIEYNPNHFITRNMEIAGNITGYNDVTPKAGADRIIITTTGKPVLTTWRYGLGRVAALTTDNGEGGGNRWSSQMYSGSNSKLTSSMINWAIGNPRAEQGAVLEGLDTWLGTPVTLTLTMYEEGLTPELTLNNEPIELSMTGKNTYETTIDPKRTGLHYVSGYPVAVNYALEYLDVGLNEELPMFIKANGGKTYTEQEARAFLLEDARTNSQRIVREPLSLKMYFILAALGLFLVEIIIRRIREIQEAKRAEKAHS